MLKRAKRRLGDSVADIRLELGDAGALPYADASFDAVIMHLILAVVPHSQQVLAEAARVLRPGGRILVLDKFLRPGQRAPVRRLISPVLGALATRTNVVFEDLLSQQPDLDVTEDHPALAGGWFRHIVVKKR
jgi:ubiquinone/menaquinone biosynthesis C-methylase UbiE